MNQLMTQPGGQQAITVDSDAAQFLTFFVCGERYAIAILDVNEIIEVGQTTHVPMTPPYLRGVINQRGSVVPVVDLGARLGGDILQLDKRSCIILVDVESAGERQLIGMLVDEVNEILEIPAADVQAAPDFGTDIRTEFIQGLGRVGELFLILLDINHVLSVPELAVLRQTVEGV